MDVFENLLHNAVKHGKSKNIEIIIGFSRFIKNEKEYIKIEFIDKGPGIKDDLKMLIFKKGFQYDKKNKGMGLGLSLVKNIIENYNGEILVQDRISGDYSKGCNFILLIPEA